MTIIAAGGRGRPGNGHEVADDQSECEQSCQDESLHRTSPSFLPLNHVTDSRIDCARNWALKPIAQTLMFCRRFSTYCADLHTRTSGVPLATGTFSSGEPTHCWGDGRGRKEGKHLRAYASSDRKASRRRWYPSSSGLHVFSRVRSALAECHGSMPRGAAERHREMSLMRQLEVPRNGSPGGQGGARSGAEQRCGRRERPYGSHSDDGPSSRGAVGESER